MYQWIFICGIFFALYNAWGIGANDCANSFATSVGSGVLTIKKAVVIAAIFEFSGAVLMGSHVTDTVRKSIVDIEIFDSNPGALMYGMLCADLASAIWLTLATYLKYPVSTTHSIIGAIVGFSLAYGGQDAVDWKKIGFIVLSWVASPLIAGIFAFCMFYVIQKFIFGSKKPFEYTMILFPILTFFTFFINVLFIIYKGSPKLDLDEMELWKCMLISIGIGTFTALLAQYVYLPYVKKRIDGNENQIENGENQIENGENPIEMLGIRTNSYIKANKTITFGESNTDEEDAIIPVRVNNKNYTYDNSKTIEFNINESKKYTSQLEKEKLDNKVSKLHKNAIDIDKKSDQLCSWLQIITACFSSFAHGSNDVANAIAPLATIFAIYKNGYLLDKSEVPIWILVLGGVGIVIGLGTWGYKIIDRIGKELTKITPSRGFVIELAAATTVIIASRAEIPISTTHCQVGSILGCGMAGGIKNIEWSLVKGILFSWLVTLPFTGFLSAALFSFGYYSPYADYIAPIFNSSGVNMTGFDAGSSSIEL
jgi:solute carrier family 20 (sodium-dependent phosphate transporter)